MKAIQKICLVFLGTAALLLNACNLEEVLVDTPTPKTVTSENDVNAVIIGLYSRFNDSGMFKYLGFNQLILTADDIYSTAGSDYTPFARRTLTSGNTGFMWNNLIYTIREANNLISILDKLEFSTDYEKRAYGEAYFIRAFCYYYLVRLYGGVPIRTEVANIDSDFYLKRNTIEETYELVFSDFKAASGRLPLASAIPNTQLGRASKGAAQAFLAQGYLTYGNQLALKGQDPATYYQNSVLYADSVISSGQYSLLANYGDLFDINKESAAYAEVIFGVRFQTDNQNRAQPAAGSEYAYSFGAGNTGGVSSGGKAGNNAYRVAHWFADYYRTGDYLVAGAEPFPPNIDYRNEKAFHQRTQNLAGRYYVVYPNIPGSIPGSVSSDATINDPILAKYQDPGGKDERNHGNDLFILRYAEVLLLKAEALNELNGPTPATLAPFNLVRSRARTVNSVPNARPIPANIPDNTLLGKDAFRMKIFDERGIEFVGEGGRWFDLVRMRSPLGPSMTMYEYQFMNRLNNSVIYPRTLPTGYNATTMQFTTPKNAVYEFILNVSVPKFLLFPIPNTEMTLNPNFGLQNPGW